MGFATVGTAFKRAETLASAETASWNKHNKVKKAKEEDLNLTPDQPVLTLYRVLF